MADFDNKVVLVIGGTTGIGRQAALKFAARGAKLVVVGRTPKAGAEVVQTIKHAGGEAFYLPVDVADTASVETLVAETSSRFGRIDCAFNNAGWEGVGVPLAEQEEVDWQKMLEIKLSGTWRCMKFELQKMQNQTSGVIVNMAGSWGLIGFANHSAYCAAAHGILGLTKTAALEYARQGIRVNALCPGAVDTMLLDRLLGGNAEIKMQMAAGLPMGRLSTPDEVAEAVLWLASDAASYVNGEALNLSGG